MENQPNNLEQQTEPSTPSNEYQPVLDQYAANIEPISPEPVDMAEVPQPPIVNSEPVESAQNTTTYDLPVAPKTSFFKILFTIALIIFIIVVAVLGFTYFKNKKTSNPGSSIFDTVKITPTEVPTITCFLNDKTYRAGESFPSADGCNTCSCISDSNIVCTEKACDITTTPAATEVFKVSIIGTDNKVKESTILTEALKNPLTVTGLIIDMCSHQSTPIELSQFTNLISLNLYGQVAYNENGCKTSLFTKIDSSLSKLTKLESLSINGDNLILIPDTVFNITSLKSLAFNNSQISSVSSKLSSLKNLEKLDLSFNEQLKTLPSLTQLTKLKTVVLNSKYFTSNTTEQNNLKTAYPSIQFEFTQ